MRHVEATKMKMCSSEKKKGKQEHIQYFYYKQRVLHVQNCFLLITSTAFFVVLVAVPI